MNKKNQLKWFKMTGVILSILLITIGIQLTKLNEELVGNTFTAIGIINIFLILYMVVNSKVKKR